MKSPLCLLFLAASLFIGCAPSVTQQTIVNNFRYNDRVVVSNPNSFYRGFSGYIHHRCTGIFRYENTTLAYAVILDKKDGELLKEPSKVMMEFKPEELSLEK